MADSFDPYRKWLGIPSQEQPPDHYRLLGLRPFEDDPDVISHAADARIVHLKTFQTGQEAVLSQRLLNEVAAASVCLLNPQQKAEYDRQLQSHLSTASVRAQEPSSVKPPPEAPPLQAPPPQPPPPQPPPPTTTPETADLPSIKRSPVSTYVSRRRRPTWLVSVLILSGLIVLLALLALALDVF